MKASRFNTFADYDDESVLAYNSMTGGLIKLDREYYDAYLQLTSEDAAHRPDPDDPITSALAADLARGGFLIDDGLDEIDYLKVFVSRSKYLYDRLSLTIAVTTACNFKCDYCYESGIQAVSMSREVEERIIHHVKTSLKEKDRLHITWYGGEPLLALDTIYRLSNAFMEIAAEKEAEYSAGIVTNGYLLDAQTAAELMKRKVNFAQITLDGDREEHDKNRPLKSGEGTFDRIIHNIRESADIMPISIRVNLGRHNIASYARLLDILDETGISKKIVTVVPSLLDAFEFSPQCVKDTRMDSEEFSKVSLELAKMTFARGIDTSIHSSGPPHISCTSIKESNFVVGPDGSLYKCWDILGRADEIVGTIDEDVRLKDGSVKWLAWDCFGSEDCRDCKVLPLCLGGCPRKALSQDDAHCASTRCSKLKYNLDEWVRLMYIQQREIRKPRKMA